MQYSMAQAEALSGIKAHTLRIWEKRYDFLKPSRTSTKIRYYSDEQLKLLLNVSVLINQGFRISKISKMPLEEINQRVADTTQESGNEPQNMLKSLTIAMLDMDEIAFEKVWQHQTTQSDLLSTVTQTIYPFLAHVGVLWGTNQAMPAQEHFVSNLIRQKIITATDALPIAPDSAPCIAMFLLDGEDHEIGLLLAAYIAKQLGWRVYYLGQKVPFDNVGQVVEICQPDLMMTMVVTPKTAKQTPDLKRLVEINNTPLLYSGSIPDLSTHSLVTFIPTPDELINYLKNWKC